MANSNGELIRVLRLGELFSLPLTALIEADAQAATAAADFIVDFGFEPGSTGEAKLGPLRTLSFSYQRVDEIGVTRSHVVTIPLISLIPLPLLSVKEAKFQFGVDIFGAVEKPVGPDGARATVARLSQSRETAPGRQENSPKQFLGSISRERTRSGGGLQSVSLDADLTVSIDMKPSDMPTGLAHFLALTGEGTIDRPDGEYNMSIQVKDGSLDLDNIGDGAVIEIALTDRQDKGLPEQMIEIGETGGSVLEITNPVVRTDKNGRAAVKLIWKEELGSLPATRTVFVHGVVQVADAPAVRLSERIEFRLGM